MNVRVLLKKVLFAVGKRGYLLKQSTLKSEWFVTINVYSSLMSQPSAMGSAALLHLAIQGSRFLPSCSSVL